MAVGAAALITAGLVVGVAALVVLHLLPTGLSPLRNAVSQYGITRFRAGYRVQTLAFACAGAGAAVGIASLPGPGGVAIALCTIFAAARALISWFPMDVPGTPITETGRRHGLLAIAAFLSIGLAGWRFSDLLGRDGLHPGIATASSVLASLMLVSLVGMPLIRRSGYGLFGLVERGFYVCMTAWLADVALLLYLPH